MTTTYDWAFVDPTTGNISHIMSIQDNNQISQGQTIDGLKAALIDSSVTHTEAIKKTYWDYDAGTWGVRAPLLQIMLYGQILRHGKLIEIY